MAETADFEIGADVTCVDGVCGEVTQVVIDPVAEAVTHLVVEPRHRRGLGRLVPLRLVEGCGKKLMLRCSLREFHQLDSAEDMEFIPGSAGYTAYGPSQVLAWPYYGLGGGMGMGVGTAATSQTVTYDALPPGEVGVRRGDRVYASDGPIGQVQGLVVDPRSHHITHVLLKEGHLWGRKEVAIPIKAVTGTDDDIRLSITKEQVEHLPAVDVDHRAP